MLAISYDLRLPSTRDPDERSIRLTATRSAKQSIHSRGGDPNGGSDPASQQISGQQPTIDDDTMCDDPNDADLTNSINDDAEMRFSCCRPEHVFSKFQKC